MSRRRGPEADDPSIEETLPLTGGDDLANGKKRSATEKAGRFFRQRPVTSLILVLVICVISLITFGIGRMVGHAVLRIFRPETPVGTLDDSIGAMNPLSALHFNKQDAHLQNDPAGNAGDGDGDDGDDDNDADEQGTLLDGAPKLEGPPLPAERRADVIVKQNIPTGPVDCHRKYEPGKMGWPRTLCVTDEFFFDISIDSQRVGTFKIGVFGEVVPKSVANFRALATCTGAFSDESLCFKGDSFHRVVTNFVAQGGSKATGRSIYGPTFKEEQSANHHSFLEHSEKGVVSWAEYPIGSQFFVLLRDEARYLDSNHVVFGVVTEGLEVLDKIHDAPRSGEEPRSRINIDNCGDAHAKI